MNAAIHTGHIYLRLDYDNNMKSNFPIKLSALHRNILETPVVKQTELRLLNQGFWITFQIGTFVELQKASECLEWFYLLM